MANKTTKIDLRKPITIGDNKIGFRLLSIVREYARLNAESFDETIAFAQKAVKRNFIVPKGKEKYASDNLALFLVGNNNNFFSKIVGR